MSYSQCKFFTPSKTLTIVPCSFWFVLWSPASRHLSQDLGSPCSRPLRYHQTPQVQVHAIPLTACPCNCDKSLYVSVSQLPWPVNTDSKVTHSYRAVSRVNRMQLTQRLCWVVRPCSGVHGFQLCFSIMCANVYFQCIHSHAIFKLSFGGKTS